MMKRSLSFWLTFFLFLFYAFIVMFIFFAVLHINTAANFLTALIFECLGIILAAFFILGGIAGSGRDGVYSVALAFVSVVYMLLVDFVCMALVSVMPGMIFILINLICLFIYCLVAAPMYIMGRREQGSEEKKEEVI